MMRILIAGPDGCYPNCDIDENAETGAFFTSDQAECFGSVNPDDVEQCDGMVVPGGPPDVNPAYWNEKNIACGIIDEEMDRQQMAMIDRAAKLGKPIMGLCRGHQLVSVYFGASLVQDIAHADTHRYEPGNPKFHRVYNIPGTYMHDLFGETIKGNSCHHQALKKLPDCLKISQLWCYDEERASEYIRMAQAGELREGTDECVIEAVYHTNYPFVGLQWHPELRGELYCRQVELPKIRNYFYEMIKRNQEEGKR